MLRHGLCFLSMLCLLACSLLFSVVFAESVITNSWPKVEEVHSKTHFDDPDDAGIDVLIKGTDGKNLYALSCHSGIYEGDPEVDYSGLLQCALKSLYSTEDFVNLLTESEEQISDWENRGRFLENHLDHGCENYPDWGAVRNFRLRGMRLTFAIDDIEWDKEKSGDKFIRSYSFSIAIYPDKGSQSPRADPPSRPQPTWFYEDQCEPR